MRLSVRPGNGDPQAAPRCVGATLETLEDVGPDLVWYPFAAVGDGDSDVSVPFLRRQKDRRAAVPSRVGEEIQ